jgi:hypothetical protein
MKNQNEYEKRCKAIHFYKEGYGFKKILQLVQRNKRWLFKWLHRYKEHGTRFPVILRDRRWKSLRHLRQRVLPLKEILTPMGILISLLQKERSPLSEKLTPMVGLRSMELLISSGRNLRGSMLLPLFLLIERDWLLNKTIGLSNLSLSRLRVILLILYFQLQGGKLNSVCGVMIFLSIKNKFAML